MYPPIQNFIRTLIPTLTKASMSETGVNVLRPRKTENQVILLGLASGGTKNQKKIYKLCQTKQRDS